MTAVTKTVRDRSLQRIRAMVDAALGDIPASVYLFGSCARGEARASSDIDVAIDVRRQLPPTLVAKLVEQLEESTIPYVIEIVDLSNASPAFHARVRHEGVRWRR